MQETSLPDPRERIDSPFRGFTCGMSAGILVTALVVALVFSLGGGWPLDLDREATVDREYRLARCDEWRFIHGERQTGIESTMDAADLALEYVYGLNAALSCADLDPSYQTDVNMYAIGLLDVIEILTLRLIGEGHHD